MIIELLSDEVEVTPNDFEIPDVFLDVPADSVAERPVVTDGVNVLTSTSGPTGTTNPELAPGLVEVAPDDGPAVDPSSG